MPRSGRALPHLAGCGQLGPDMRVTHETLAAYCAHPNVGAVLVVALGCEQVIAQTLAESARRARQAGGDRRDPGGRRDGPRDRRGMRDCRALAGGLSDRRASGATPPTLVLSLKCGGSDYTSGLASNPALGRVADRLVALGG